MSALFSQEMVVLFAILAVGTGVGRITIRGVSLGTAGVLFTALVFGHYGLAIPRGVMDLGLLLFVYAVGLQAGPRFFRTFRRHGLQFVLIALVVAGVGAMVTLAVGYWLKLPYDLTAGLFTGALTCTPALAAAIDAKFGSLDEFKKQFAQSAATNFGSGWTWLVKNADGSIEIFNTSNAGTPMTSGKTALLTVDVWEHAYYIDYRNARTKYLESLWDKVNWEFVAANHGG